RAGRPAEAAKPQQPANVINLMDALRKSATAEKGGAKKPEPSEREGGLRRPGGKSGKEASDATVPAPHRARRSKPEPEGAPRRGARAPSGTGTRKTAGSR